MPSSSRRLAVFALALLFSAVPRAQQAPAQEPRFRGGTNQVRLDVYATKDGVAVTDLTVADFEVLEDNAPQSVSSFEFVKARGVVPDSARVEPNTVAESRERAARPDARLFVLFLDTLHVQIEGSYHAQNPVAALLDRVVGEDDLVGVMTPEITARNIAFSPRTSSVGRMLAANWTWGERGAVNVRDPRDREIEQCYPDIGPTLGLAKPLLERRGEQRLLDSLEDLIRHLEGLREERSFVLLLSEGWLMPEPDHILGAPIKWPNGTRTVPGGPDDLGVTSDGKLTIRSEGGARGFESCERERGLLANQDFAMAFEQLMRRANRANVSFYPIDPRGLVVSDDPIGPGRPAGPVADSMRLGRRQANLRQLAEETDGAVVLNTNLEKALPRLLNDVGSYYLLGYVSTNQKLDGRYRKLTVRVKRPGLELRARPGYLAPSAAEVTAAQTLPKTKSAPTTVGQALSRLPTGRRVAPIYVQATGGAG
ncbi:MAG: VWA domain-containing protein, partial [Acidobacteriota bacterium]